MNPIIKKDRVVPAEPEAALPNRRRAHSRVARLQSVEGEVRAIEFHCSCGEVSVIELEYTEAESAGSAPRSAKEPKT